MKQLLNAILATMPVLLFCLYLVVVLLTFWMVNMDWTGVEVVRWVGALSGWAAAVAASATIFVLLHQIRKNEDTAFRRQNEAKNLFDCDVKPTLELINDTWKRAEDCYSVRLDDAVDLSMMARNIKGNISLIRSFFEKKRASLESFVALMHPADAAERRKLIKAIQYSCEPFNDYFVEPETGNEGYDEPEGEEFIRRFIATLVEELQDLNYVSAEIDQVFISRNREPDIETLDFRTTYRNFHLGRLPDNPDNPY